MKQKYALPVNEDEGELINRFVELINRFVAWLSCGPGKSFFNVKKRMLKEKKNLRSMLLVQLMI